MLEREEIDNPLAHTRCKSCGATYFKFYNNPHIACNCDFYLQYERDMFGDGDDDFGDGDDDFAQSDSTDR